MRGLILVEAHARPADPTGLPTLHWAGRLGGRGGMLGSTAATATQGKAAQGFRWVESVPRRCGCSLFL